MGGVFGVASSDNCITDLFFGVDYHSHLGTRRGGLAVYNAETGFERAIHTPSRTPPSAPSSRRICLTSTVAAASAASATPIRSR